MRRIVLYIIMIVLLIQCNSSELIDNWKNPSIDMFRAEKVLVVGITSDKENIFAFENKLRSQLIKRGVEAIASSQYFDQDFTKQFKSEPQLLSLESKLIRDGFDAILISKVLGRSNKVTLGKSLRNIDRGFKSFREDYYTSQHLYSEDTEENYEIIHAESSLYCICPSKDRELVWKGAIDVTAPDNIKQAISDYVKLLIWVLSDQDLLIDATFGDTDILHDLSF